MGYSKAILVLKSVSQARWARGSTELWICAAAKAQNGSFVEGVREGNST